MVERGHWRRPGLTTDERKRLHDLEREVKELRRANEILKAASVAAVPDRSHHGTSPEAFARAWRPQEVNWVP